MSRNLHGRGCIHTRVDEVANGGATEIVGDKALVLIPHFLCLFSKSTLNTCPNAHPLTAKTAIEITDLHELPLAIIRGDIEPPFGEDLNRIFGVARFRPRIFHEATSKFVVLMVKPTPMNSSLPMLVTVLVNLGPQRISAQMRKFVSTRQRTTCR